MMNCSDDQGRGASSPVPSWLIDTQAGSSAGLCSSSFTLSCEDGLRSHLSSLILSVFKFICEVQMPLYRHQPMFMHSQAFHTKEFIFGDEVFIHLAVSAMLSATCPL